MTARMQDLLQQAIRQAGGLLPFPQFMQQVLYHPECGYYMTRRSRLGREGDFVTAPEMTSLFGEMLTLQCVEIWQRLGQPTRFQVVEAGAGSGRLAADICQTARRFAHFYQALSYTILEISPDFQATQRQTLAAAGVDPARVCWVADLAAFEEESLEGVLLSNEFLDAFPVHWLEMTPEGLRERGVAWEEGGLTSALMPVTLPLVADYFIRAGVVLPVGMRTELGLAAAEWMAAAAARLRRGVILTIDYGYTQQEYYSSALPEGTLTGFYRHQQLADPLLHPGEMDLTAHVNFTAVARAGVEAGLTTLGYTTQAWFLMGLGLLQRLEQLSRSQGEAALAPLRQTVLRLIMPQGMGDRFKVLVQGKGLDAEPALAGFSLHNAVQRLEGCSPPGTNHEYQKGDIDR
ncbi:MAG: SAM-dependent methyltransferase [Magnetococcales bacterium]|nr:SAM-dependent methyltransferase [Magnetococcales bacterium]